MGLDDFAAWASTSTSPSASSRPGTANGRCTPGAVGTAGRSCGWGSARTCGARAGRGYNEAGMLSFPSVSDHGAFRAGSGRIVTAATYADPRGAEDVRPAAAARWADEGTAQGRPEGVQEAPETHPPGRGVATE